MEYPKIQQFRIWSPEEKKFYFSGGTPMMLSGFFKQTATLHTVHKQPYQRGTDIFDKNGKEIYEGDIVRDNYYKYTFEVKWEQLDLTQEGVGFGYKFSDYMDYLEITGHVSIE